MTNVSRLLDNATRILEAAETMRTAGHEAADWCILVGPSGELHMVADSDWSLDSLKKHHGASLAYRVRQQDGRICVEGKDDRRDIEISSNNSSRVVRLLLPERRNYQMGK